MLPLLLTVGGALVLLWVMKPRGPIGPPEVVARVWDSPPPTAQPSIWQVSERGNPTYLSPNGLRLTVFNNGDGWKYSLGSDFDDKDAVFFSDFYPTEAAAKAAAMQHFLEEVGG